MIKLIKLLSVLVDNLIYSAGDSHCADATRWLIFLSHKWYTPHSPRRQPFVKIETIV